MTRKDIIALIIFLFFVILSLIFIVHVVKYKKQKKEKYQTILPFELYDLKGQKITESVLKRDKSTLFLFFDPACESCKYELKQINLFKDTLQDYQFVFSSTLPKDTIISFLNGISFQPPQNMFFVVDENADLMNAMDVKIIPSFFVYNKNGRLVQRFDGPAKIEFIIKYLSEN